MLTPDPAFDCDADPDPVSHSDKDPDPTSQNDVDPDSGSATLQQPTSIIPGTDDRTFSTSNHINLKNPSGKKKQLNLFIIPEACASIIENLPVRHHIKRDAVRFLKLLPI
jgi:hypothetical protein